MAAPTRRVLLLALASRALVLGAMALSGWAFADLDSSARLAGFPCAAEGADAADAWAASGAAANTHPAAPTSLLLPVWDTVYFSRVAKCGYETDKSNAFFPLLPAAMRAAAQAAGACVPAAAVCAVPPLAVRGKTRTLQQPLYAA